MSEYYFIFLLLSIIFQSFTKKAFLEKKNYRKLKQEENSIIDEEDIIILHTNDVHCGLMDYIGYDGLMLYKRELQSKYKYVITVDAGDHIQGGAIGLLSKGLDIIDIMNKIGYDVVTLGNHEFDYGIEQLNLCNETLKSGYISSNYCFRKNKTSIFPPYKIIDAGDKKIGFIGVSTPQTLSKTYLHNIVDEDGKMVYDFLTENEGKELFDNVQNYIDEVRKKGANYVIILSHLGNEGDSLEQYTSNGLLSHINGIDALIDGHSHKIYNTTSKDKDKKEIPLAQTGTKLLNLGIMKIKSDGTILSEILSEIPHPENTYSYATIIDRNNKQRFIDKEMNNYLNNIFNSHSDELNEKIGYTDFNLLINMDNSDDSSKQISRSEESTLCDLVADAIRDIGKGDICLINAGSIRANLIKGDITLQNILDILPFSADIVIKEVYGKDILDALEFGMKDLPGKTSRFPQVSGISFKVNTKIKSSVVIDDEEMFVKVDGDRRVYDVKVGGKKLDVNKKYKLSFDNYISNGGDGFSMFNKYEEISNVLKTDNEALMIYIRDVLNGKIPDEYKQVQKRIVIDENDDDKNSGCFLWLNIWKIIIIIFFINKN